MARVLVVGGEASRVRALGHVAVDDFFQRVDALAGVLRVGDEHEMHAVGVLLLDVGARGEEKKGRKRTWRGGFFFVEGGSVEWVDGCVWC